MPPRASAKKSDGQTRTIALSILGLFQTALVILAVYHYFPGLASDHVTLFGSGLVALATTAYIMYRVLFVKLKLTSPVGFIFTFIAFTAYIDIMLALCLISPEWSFGRFYLDKGERYFNSTYGFICLFYDGTVQFALQFTIAVLAFSKKNYHFVGLVWAGSVLNSMAPLLLGAAIGPFSDQIQASMALNVPYVFLPLGMIVILLNQSAPHHRKEKPGSRVGSHHVLTDVVLLTFNFVMPIIHILRAMAVMGSKSSAANFWRTIEPTLDYSTQVEVNDKQDFAFMAVQSVQWAFWFALWHWAALYEQVERIRTGKRSFLLFKHGVDLAAIALGGYLQSTVCFTVTAYFDMREGVIGIQKRTPGPPLEFWIINLATVICALLHFVHFHVQDVEDVLTKDA